MFLVQTSQVFYRIKFIYISTFFTFFNGFFQKLNFRFFFFYKP